MKRMKIPFVLDVKWKDLKKLFYGTNCLVDSDFGFIDFSRIGKKEIVRGEKLTYDEYLDAQYASHGKARKYLSICFFEVELGLFEGKVQAINDKYLCFESLTISGAYGDGSSFKGREDHVWMDKKGFDGLKIGDCVSFCAEIYRYLKTGDSKMIDYGLRNPFHIKKIKSFTPVTDIELELQDADEVICMFCPYYGQCQRQFYCVNQSWRYSRRRAMFREILQPDNSVDNDRKT